MRLDQFFTYLTALRFLAFHPYIDLAGCIRLRHIRTGLNYCPMTAVCAYLYGIDYTIFDWNEAGKRHLKLPRKSRFDIRAAADRDDDQYSRETRKRLLDALGLSE